MTRVEVNQIEDGQRTATLAIFTMAAPVGGVAPIALQTVRWQDRESAFILLDPSVAKAVVRHLRAAIKEVEGAA